MNLKRLKFIDKPFLISLVLIIGFGLVVLSSASQGISGDPYFYVKKQVLFLGVGLIAALLVLRYDYSHLRRYGIILYGLSVFLLIAVLVVGEEVRGTTGWISLGPLPAVQPAEFTKIMLAISFADFLNKRKGMLNTLGEILPCIVYMGVPFVLILMQPDLGTALVYIAMTVVMMFVAGANPRILGGLIALGAGFIGLMLFMHFQYGMWLPLEDYQIKRLTVFLNPYEDGKGGRGAGWNTIQSLIAIGSGGLTGLGLFNGTQVQLNFLPEHHTDFIYAVIGEEMGFIGAAGVILLYTILLLRAIYISFHAKDLFGTLIVTGITAMWLFHIFENIGMSIGIMPITGIPLPFLSYGGSSMITNLIAVGLVLSVNVRGRKIVF
ncbi:MAG: rod shape-determining protein RodA [Syntrophomonadaceae bacterium]|nr:rod shape-determining protein RodA [Bacillota bacterium]NLM87879.1 rod shape-determining protein RodA [Syntrophomonadaceae bacterium]HAA08570.1 rod shape-determining protein RodA [Syntrophomonas sp.]HQA50148.1 rod shape-determining protein RodA [Syntrophomonadaceae bacterium]HQD90092.1 rod shape-determining protein RodA [Syntrophomonadaceae bacterium]